MLCAILKDDLLLFLVQQCQANSWVTLNVGHAGGAGGDVGVGDLLL